MCGIVHTKEHHWKSCQYTWHEILGKTYPAGFKVDSSLAKKTKDNLKRERFHNLVHKVLTSNKAPESSNMTTSDETNRDSPETFNYDDDAAMPGYSGFNAAPEQAPPIADSEGSFLSGTYPLHNSDLLDTGTTLHICNNANKFTELHPAQPNDGVFAGRTWIPIKQRGTRILLFYMGKDHAPTKFTLQNVAHIPGYHTNLV